MKHVIPALAAPALALALAACGDADRGDETTLAENDPIAAGDGATPPAPPQGARDDTDPAMGPTAAPGGWTTKTMAGAPAALFGPPDSEAAFSVRCEDGTLVLSRSVLLPEGEASMTVAAGGETRTLAASSSPDPMPSVTARLPGADPFIGQLADATGAISVTVGGERTLEVPSAPAFRQVVGGCMAS
jgi:hypothetical protein